MTSLRLSWRFVNRRVEAIFLSVCVCCVCLFSVNIRLDRQTNKPHDSRFKFSQSSLEVESLTAVSSQQGSQGPETSSSTTPVIYYNSSCFFFNSFYTYHLAVLTPSSVSSPFQNFLSLFFWKFLKHDSPSHLLPSLHHHFVPWKYFALIPKKLPRPVKMWNVIIR